MVAPATLSNVLSALREGDYSLRARGADARDDSLGLVYLEADALAEMLRGQRLGALEAGALLRSVLEQIDTAIFALISDGRLRLVNSGRRTPGWTGRRTISWANRPGA